MPYFSPLYYVWNSPSLEPPCHMYYYQRSYLNLYYQPSDSNKICTVKILKFGTLQTIAIIVLKIE